MKQYLYIGTYTREIVFGTGEVFRGKGKGISICSFENGKITECCTVPALNPSFLCANPYRKKLYAVNETKEYKENFGGGVTEFSYNIDVSEKENDCFQSVVSIIEKSTFNTGGTDPCHIVEAPDGSFLAVSNFASGSLSIFGLNEDGSLNGKKTIFQHEGKSIHPIRQMSPHAHSAIFSPDGKWMYVPDLGMDILKAYTCKNGVVRPNPRADRKLFPGSGPRFGEFSKDGKHFYLINELASQVVHFTYEDGELTEQESVSTLPANFDGDNICSDLHLSVDGKYLYASNRGHDSIVCYSIGRCGELSCIEWVFSGGKTPRNFCIDPLGKYILAGNQDSDNITIFKVQSDGRLRVCGQETWGSPVCIKFF